MLRPPAKHHRAKGDHHTLVFRRSASQFIDITTVCRAGRRVRDRTGIASSSPNTILPLSRINEDEPGLNRRTRKHLCKMLPKPTLSAQHRHPTEDGEQPNATHIASRILALASRSRSSPRGSRSGSGSACSSWN